MYMRLIDRDFFKIVEGYFTVVAEKRFFEDHGDIVPVVATKWGGIWVIVT